MQIMVLGHICSNMQGGMEELFLDSEKIVWAITPQTATAFMYLYVSRSPMKECNNWGLQEIRWVRWH